ncbi:MAG: DUF5132 domain-containing protein [Anaerolineae bacterium]|nr:DUF5132 domain-containing protein [Anaerolineae bacterium]MDW8099519.1 DUF5132 domain-containing protein [Anaerolineae bacterium]
MALLNGLVEGVVEDVLGKIVSPPLLIAGAIVATPFVAPYVSKKIRPVAKQIIKGGLWTVEKGKELLSEIGEQFSDLVAESRAELAAAAAATTGVKSAPEETSSA